MKKVSIFIGLCLLIAVCAGGALAGDYAQLNFIGFSKDGRYLAFEEYGVGLPDMEGYSVIFFVDTAKNVYAAPSVESFMKESETADSDYSFDSIARRRAMAKARPVLRRLGIITGNTGRQVVSRLLTDVTVEAAPPYEPKHVAFAPDRRESMLNGRYYLNLKTVATNQVCKTDDDPELVDYVGAGGIPVAKITENPNRKKNDKDKQTLYSFELSLKIDDAGKTIVMQKALAPPSERGCAIDYRIQSVHMYRDRVAVFVGVFTPGFLGDDIRLRAVTARMADGGGY